MGRYPGTTLCADPLGGRALRLYCKLRCLIAVLRNVPHMAKTPRPLDLHSWLMPSSPQLPRLARRTAAKNLRLKLGSSGCSSALFCWDNSVLQMCPRAVRFYSSSNKETVRVDAPIGVLQRTQNALHLNSLGARLGESFHRLSKHINVYFKRKDILVEPGAGNASLIVATPQYLGRLQRRGQRAPRQRKEPTQALECDEREDISMSQTSTSTSFQRITGLQLFHISSLATKFGESYNYVANHINTTFSRRPAQEINFSQMQDTLEEPSANRTSHSSRLRRKIQRSYIQTSLDTGKTQVKMSSNPAESPVVENNNVTSKQDEGYLYFARHINSYFGAKVTDEVNEQLKQREQHTVEMMAGNNAASKQFTTQTLAKSHGVLSQLRQEERPSPKPPGLFHISSLTTSFGESYFQMANHINLYFKGQDAVVEEEEEVDKNELREIYPECAATQRLKPVSLMDCLRHPTAAIPNFLGSLLKVSPWAQNNEARPSTTPLEATYNRRMIMSRRQAEEITRGLIRSLESAVSPDVLTASLEALNEHLIRYPSCKAVMWQEKTAVKLLKHRRSSRHNQELQDVIRESLALIGYVDPVKGRGIRVLSIDGGGTRGVVPLQVLKVLRAETGKEIHQLFDYICGVSTGAVLAFMLGLARFSLEECGDMYRRFGSDVFRQNPLVGTVKMGWSHSYYCTATWEAILREKMGETLLIKTARDELSPKVSAVSAVVNWGTSPKAFVFRNYNHTPGCLSRYAGSSACMMWEAVRASSAAPGYFQEFPLQSDIHQDGGLILNNPCSLAVHESRLLWPNQPFQCVLSLGTGRYDNAKRTPATSTSLRAKISNLICSATDTEGVHTLLDDLLAPDVYFRFNPMLSAGVSLDESRPGILDQLEIDTQRYLDRNRPKIARLCLVLGAERLAVTRTKDWVSERAWEMKQRWV